MKNVTAAPPFAGTVCVTARELTGLMAVPSSVRAPSSVKSSQKVSAPSHQRLRFQPRRCVVVSGAAPKNAENHRPLHGIGRGQKRIVHKQTRQIVLGAEGRLLAVVPTIF